MTETVRIEGLEQVRVALLETPKHLRQKVMHAILRKAAAPILRQARMNAPVAKKATKYVIPGLIKKTLGITRSKLRNAARGEFGVFITARVPGKVKRSRKNAKAVGMRGPYFGDPYYHRFQEGGFYSIRGKAYLGDAYIANRERAVQIIKAETVREITAAFVKRARKNV
jgi:hypothetical protein